MLTENEVGRYLLENETRLTQVEANLSNLAKKIDDGCKMGKWLLGTGLATIVVLSTVVQLVMNL